jgi:hypothetical protein
MAEIKNTFLRGKMNKDLDSRLIPNGEYRDALNISVGKSENQSVGSLQNVLGNKQLVKPTPTGTAPFESNTDLVCIGYFVDNENNRIYQFLTDYQDLNPSTITLPPSNAEMKVTVYDPLNSGNPYVTLVEGTFLNFSTTNIITGVNLVEGLLFWTDNRNQPRKINIESALANPADSPTPYYARVEQISVAKYCPFTSPEIFTTIEGNVLYGTPALEAGQTKIQILTSTVNSTGIEIGDQLIGYNIIPGDSAIITNIKSPGGSYSFVYLSGNYTTGGYTWVAGSPLVFYRCLMTRNDLDVVSNGNDNFLADKFVRFSYRFRFDDNEYSLMAPFTQPVFIPEQKGYFINGNEDSAYRSTVLDWMQNNINSVKLLITLPDAGNNIVNSYKIKSIDILYKESDSLAVKVVETIDYQKIASEAAGSNIYSYLYDSQKPYKTLQESELARVYDKVPVRALSQESVGNRIVYGNFIDKNTPPSSLDYNVNVVEKNENFDSWIEYPNHTLKQNRNYQVGIVLSDKFGRQSSVILSSSIPYTSNGGVVYGISSVFFPYKGSFWTTDVKEWLGDQIALSFNTEIKSVKDEIAGTPGLYATVSGAIPSSTDGFEITAGVVSGNTFTYTLAASPAQGNYPLEGNYLRGKYTDYVLVTESTSGYIEADGDINEIYNYKGTSTPPDVKFSYFLNELGWYSYKVVVKQQEQEYYNVYLPGMLAGYPRYQTNGAGGTNPTSFPLGENDSTAHFVSINDNINKIPRDLSEVGPNQRQYRSSVEIWGRVENALINPLSVSTAYTTNRQYYPGLQPDVVNTIAPSNELGFLQLDVDTNPNGSAYYNLYQLETSPLVNRVTTSKKIGVEGNVNPTSTSPIASNAMSPFLSVYETSPVSSILDIFWESSTSGLISDLNADILTTGDEAIYGLSDLNFEYYENQDPAGVGEATGEANSPYITDAFFFKNAAGIPVLSVDSITLQVRNRLDQDVSSKFTLEQDLTPFLPGPVVNPTYLWWRIKITDNQFYFGTNVETYGSFVFNFTVTHTVGLATYTRTVTTNPDLLKISNIIPVVTIPAADNTPTYSLTSDPLVGPIVDVIGRNGNTSNTVGSYQANLYWTYDPEPGYDYTSYFSVNSSTGDISLKTTTIPADIYDVRVKIQDATSSSGLTTPGFLYDHRTVRIEVPVVSGCSSWDSSTVQSSPIGSPLRYSNYVTGHVNIWKYLRKNETIDTSTVKLTYYHQLGASPGLEIPVPSSTGQVVDFASFLGGFPIGYGEFGCALFTNNDNIVDLATPPDYLRFQGTITTNTGRSFEVNFISNYTSTSGSISSLPWITLSTSCTTYGYVPTTCRHWKIFNNSPFPIPWVALHGNGKSIIGGTINSFSEIGSSFYGGTQPLVRFGTLQAARTLSGSPIIGGQITYAGFATTCPV